MSWLSSRPSLRGAAALLLAVGLVFPLTGVADTGESGLFGAPVAARNADGHLEVFKVDRDGQIGHRWQKVSNGDWSAWSSLGGSFSPGIVVAPNSAEQLEVFAVHRGSHELWYAHQTTTNSTDWSAWSSLGGGLQGPIAVAQRTNGLLEVFAVTAAGRAVEHRWQTNSPDGWAAWARLGGNLLPGLVAVRNRDGRIELFGVGANSHDLVHCWQRSLGTPAQWSEWASLGGAILPGFAVCQNGVGRLEVFAVEKASHSPRRICQVSPGTSAEWTAWEEFSGSLPTTTNAVAPPDRSPVDGLPETATADRGSADSVHPPVSSIEPGMAVGQSGDGRLDVFAVDGKNHTLLHRWELLTDGSDQWSRWASMGIAAQPFPAVVANEEGDLEVFAADDKDSAVINHRRQISRASDWLDWSSLDQPNFRYRSRTWQADDGLPNNVVQALAQTPDGFLWVGTADGLARFDGVSFTPVAPASEPELQNASITALCAGHQGALWIGTDGGGLVRLQSGVFSHFGTKTGLAGDSLRAIYESKDGSLWIGTTTGMSRYRQGTFANYTRHEGLLSDVVGALYEDRAGNLWIATGEGLNRFSPVSRPGSEAPSRGAAGGSADSGLRTQDSRLQTQDFKVDAFRMPNNLPNDTVRCICQDRGGRVWIGSNNGMLWYNWFWMHSFYAYNTKYGLSDPFVSAICEDPEGDLWVGTYSGLNRFHEGRFYPERNDEGNPFDKVNALLEDHGGNLWVGSRDGLARFTPEPFTTYTRQQGLTHNNVMSVLQDQTGSLWFGTWGGGLNRLKDEKVTAYITTGTNAANVVTATAGTNRFPESLVLSLCNGHDGSLWIGADFDGGLTRLKNGRMAHYTEKEGLINAPLRVIHEDREGTLWLGTTKGLCRLRNGQLSRATRMEDGGWTMEAQPSSILHPPSSSFDSNNLPPVSAICEDHLGRLWFGTEGGLSLWQGGKFLSFTTRDGLSDNRVRSLYEDKEHSLWIGTSAGGLNRLNLDEFSRAADANTNVQPRFTFHVSRFTTRQGLFSDEVFEVLEDDQGWLWLTCSKGISRVRKQDLNALDAGKLQTVASTAYGKADGLETTQCNGAAKPAAWKARDGRLWFATSKGAVTVNPATLKVSSTPPKVFIEEVFADNKLTSVSSSPSGAASAVSAGSASDPLAIAPGRGELEFHYTALDFQAPELIRFKYKLEGVNSEWVDAGTRRVAHYDNVHPGDHRFHVIACNKDGLWSTEGASTAFYLRPHIWQTWWYRTLGALLLLSAATGSAVYFSHRRIQRQLRMLEQRNTIERERGRIAKDIHDDLGSSLTRILMLGERAAEGQDKPDDVSVHVGKIVTTARGSIQALDEIVWAVNPENDTLEGLVEYISHYADEFFENTPIRCRLEIPVRLPDFGLTAEVRHDLFLVVKEAFHNILKHSRASEVHVEVSASNTQLQVLIEDDGCGFDPAKPCASRTGNGLCNMRKRMEAMGGSFKFTSAPGQGTRLAICAPLNPGAAATS